MILEQIEPGRDGLRPRFWCERPSDGEWWMGFVSLAWKRENGDQIDFAVIPINPMEYILAPIEWPKADGNMGISGINYLSHLDQLF